jgi:hypothetical protein
MDFMKVSIRQNTLKNLLFVGPPLISVFVLDSVVTDPVNTPKLFILGVVAAGTFGTVLCEISKSEIRRHRVALLMISIFLVLATATLFTSDAPLVQSMYGTYGRNNGVLTYIFFGMLFVGGLFVSLKTTHRKIIDGLLFAGIINIFYCGWVLVFGDFIGWNNPYGNILGTFGNPNFIGAFLGMFFTAWVAILLSNSVSRNFRIASVVILPLTAIEIYFSRAIQGRVLMVGGASLVMFFWIWHRFKNQKLLIAYSLITSVGAGFALAGALQAGPLASLIYKNSVSLRGQYWLSAWNTGNSHPLTGVGFDSLGDWYRRMRDSRALELPGRDTVINAAHNVPLDMLAFGGWPLLVTYVALIFFIAIKSIRLAFRLKGYDPIFVALFTTWICYHLQSTISINQIGLGIWGWLLSGALLSYIQITETDFNLDAMKEKEDARKVKQRNEPVVSPKLAAGLSMVLGALIAVPPLASDMSWVEAQRSRDATKLSATLVPGYLNPQNPVKYYMTIQIFEQSNLLDLSHKYALEAVAFNPNSYDLWQMLSLLRNTTDEEKALALLNMRRLDPLNPSLMNSQ